MKHKIGRSKTPVSNIVIGILFVGMLGTTIYSVGQMQIMKRDASGEVTNTKEFRHAAYTAFELMEYADRLITAHGKALQAVKPFMWNTGIAKAKWAVLDADYTQLLYKQHKMKQKAVAGTGYTYEQLKVLVEMRNQSE